MYIRVEQRGLSPERVAERYNLDIADVYEALAYYHEVFHRLENYGHDVEHVDFVSELGKGTNEYPIAQYSRDADRVIDTYDDDFVLEVDESDYRAVLDIHDARLPVNEVADIVHAVSQHYSQDAIQGLVYIGKEWL